MKKNVKINRALTAIVNALVYVFCALCLLLLLFTVFSKRDADGAVNLFGYQMRIVLSGSMEKNSDVDVSDYRIKDIKTGSMVFVQLVPEDVTEAEKFYSELKVGDVLTFRYDVSAQQFEGKTAPQMTVTHRIIDIQPGKAGGYVITLRGDNVSTTQAVNTQIIDTANDASPNYVIGKVGATSFILGWLVYSLQRPLGLVMLVIVPSAIILFWQVVKIVSVIYSGKNKKEELLQTNTDKLH